MAAPQLAAAEFGVVLSCLVFVSCRTRQRSVKKGFLDMCAQGWELHSPSDPCLARNVQKRGCGPLVAAGGVEQEGMMGWMTNERRGGSSARSLQSSAPLFFVLGGRGL
jgi:hypothetical protein